MKIDSDINLVVPVRVDGDEVLVYGYHTPISRQVFEANYRIIAATKAALSSKGSVYSMSAGPQISALALLDEGRKDAAEHGELDNEGQPLDGGANALLAEIRRLTSVLVAGDNGWSLVPVDIAISQGKIDDEEWKESESAIVFFTCHFHLFKRAERMRLAQATATLLSASTTFLKPMEFASSLPTLTKPESTHQPSSVPS